MLSTSARGWSRISRPAPALSGAAYTRSIAFAPAIHPPISNRSATASYISGASRTQIGEPEKHEGRILFPVSLGFRFMLLGVLSKRQGRRANTLPRVRR
ncbi:MAG: hypothetical protein IPJ28_08685 [Betaproteobacteria bacterium]|nr:hypothetical protein [Betaproteobacteria bacterium]